MATSLFDLISKTTTTTKRDVAKLHDKSISKEEEAKILKALEETGYENLPD